METSLLHFWFPILWAASFLFSESFADGLTLPVKGEFAQINDLFRQGLVKSGNVYRTVDGPIMMALSSTELVSFPPDRMFADTASFATTKLPAQKSFFIGITQPQSQTQYGLFDAAKSIAVARQFQDKVLPFGSVNCNSDHYWLYILYAKTHKYSSCPLNKPLHELSPMDIEKENSFPFLDGQNRIVLSNSFATLIFTTPVYPALTSQPKQGQTLTTRQAPKQPKASAPPPPPVPKATRPPPSTGPVPRKVHSHSRSADDMKIERYGVPFSGQSTAHRMQSMPSSPIRAETVLATELTNEMLSPLPHRVLVGQLPEPTTSNSNETSAKTPKYKQRARSKFEFGPGTLTSNPEYDPVRRSKSASDKKQRARSKFEFGPGTLTSSPQYDPVRRSKSACDRFREAFCCDGSEN